MERGVVGSQISVDCERMQRQKKRRFPKNARIWGGRLLGQRRCCSGSSLSQSVFHEERDAIL